MRHATYERPFLVRHGSVLVLTVLSLVFGGMLAIRCATVDAKAAGPVTEPRPVTAAAPSARTGIPAATALSVRTGVPAATALSAQTCDAKAEAVRTIKSHASGTEDGTGADADGPSSPSTIIIEHGDGTFEEYPIEPGCTEPELTPMPDEAERAFAAVPLSVVLAEADANDLPVPLVLGLLDVECKFDPYAVNPETGCYGPCQLNPAYFPSGLSPEENIVHGFAYLREQLDRYDQDAQAALAAYHAGHDDGDRYYSGCVLAQAAYWAETLGLDY